MSDDSEKVDLERLCKLCIDNGFSTGHADTAIEFAGECVANLLDGKKKIEQLQAKVPVWIPVSERLPEDGQYVLVGVQSRGTVMLAKYFGDGGFSVYPQKDVTHWMSLLPLPIPPLEQEKNNERYS